MFNFTAQHSLVALPAMKLSPCISVCWTGAQGKTWCLTQHITWK